MKNPKLLTTQAQPRGIEANNNLTILVSLNRDPALAEAPC